MPTSSPTNTSPAARTYTLSDFDFVLPEALIAQHPAPERSGSKLLDGTQATPTNRIFRELPQLLRKGDLVVFNDTKVINARLFGEKPTGGKLELLVERVLSGNQVAAHMRVSKKPEVGTTVALVPSNPVWTRERNPWWLATEIQPVLTVPAACAAGSMVARTDSSSLPFALGNIVFS